MRAPPPIEIPIDGTLDLHSFQPSEIGSLVPAYLEACRNRGIDTVRIVHGKGTGALREGVHQLLRRLPDIETLQHPCGAAEGGWGATRVRLRLANRRNP